MKRRLVSLVFALGVAVAGMALPATAASAHDGGWAYTQTVDHWKKDQGKKRHGKKNDHRKPVACKNPAGKFPPGQQPVCKGKAHTQLYAPSR